MKNIIIAKKIPFFSKLYSGSDGSWRHEPTHSSGAVKKIRLILYILSYFGDRDPYQAISSLSYYTYLSYAGAFFFAPLSVGVGQFDYALLTLHYFAYERRH